MLSGPGLKRRSRPPGQNRPWAEQRGREGGETCGLRGDSWLVVEVGYHTCPLPMGAAGPARGRRASIPLEDRQQLPARAGEMVWHGLTGIPVWSGWSTTRATCPSPTQELCVTLAGSWGREKAPDGGQLLPTAATFPWGTSWSKGFPWRNLLPAPPILSHVIGQDRPHLQHY